MKKLLAFVLASALTIGIATSQTTATPFNPQAEVAAIRAAIAQVISKVTGTDTKIDVLTKEIAAIKALLTVKPPVVVPPPPPPPVVTPPPTPTPRTATITSPMDTVPDPCYQPTVVNVTSGAWSAPATWGGTLPPSGAKVQIALGSTVSLDLVTPSFSCVGIAGNLAAKPDVTTSVTAGTILVYDTGNLTLIPLTGRSEVVIANRPLDLVNDPKQYGTGLLSWGTITMAGTQKDSFLRVSKEPLKGDRTFTFAQAPVGWVPGDRIVIPDTRQLSNTERTTYAPQWEELTLTAVSGTTVTFSTPLAFDHIGARDGNGTLDFLPHVANLTRNVVIRSENPSGTRGHVWLTARSTVDLRYVTFKDLGRTTNDPLDNTNGTHLGTNQIGRYPLHAHHLIGPSLSPANGNQFTFIGNAIDQGSTRHKFKWGVAIHDSHYGLIQDNVVYNVAGAGVTTEDGSESYNLFDHNFVLRATSDFASRGDGRSGEYGYEATGFWFRGPNNRVRNNVAANILDGGPDSAYGFKLYQYFLGKVTIPTSRGADPMTQGTIVDSHTLPFLEFGGNEVYGATESGLAWWWVGIDYMTPKSTLDTVVKDFKVWHVFNKGIFGYNGNRIIVDGMVVRGTNALGSACCNTAIYLPDYPAPSIIIRHADLQGMAIGIQPTTSSLNLPQTIEDSYIRAYTTGILIGSQYTSGNGTEGILPRVTNINRVKFDPWPGRTLSSIVMSFGGATSFTNLVQRDDVFVTDYNQVGGANFRLYYLEAAPGFIMPLTTKTPPPENFTILKGCPEGGLTNAQCFAKYGVAIGGTVATCPTTRPDLTGFACTN